MVSDKFMTAEFKGKEIMRLAPGSVIHPGVTILYNGQPVFSIPAAAEAPYTVEADDRLALD